MYMYVSLCDAGMHVGFAGSVLSVAYFKHIFSARILFTLFALYHFMLNVFATILLCDQVRSCAVACCVLAAALQCR